MSVDSIISLGFDPGHTTGWALVRVYRIPAHRPEWLDGGMFDIGTIDHRFAPFARATVAGIEWPRCGPHINPQHLLDTMEEASGLAKDASHLGLPVHKLFAHEWRKGVLGRTTKKDEMSIDDITERLLKMYVAHIPQVTLKKENHMFSACGVAIEAGRREVRALCAREVKR